MATPYTHLHESLAPAANQPLVVQTSGYLVQGAGCGRLQERWNAKSVHSMGLLILVTGVICIALNTAEIIMHTETGTISHGIWCGVLYIVTGAFAIVAGKMKTYGFIVTCMVLSIVSAVFATPVLALSIVGLVNEKTNWYYEEGVTGDPDCCHEGYEECCEHFIFNTKTLPTRQALHALMLLMGVIEGILAICTAAYCCQAVGCCAKPQAGSSSSGGQPVCVVVVQGTSGNPQAAPLNTQGIVYNSPQPTGAQVQGVSQSGQPQQQPEQGAPPPATYSIQHMQPVGNGRPPPYQN